MKKIIILLAVIASVAMTSCKKEGYCGECVAHNYVYQNGVHFWQQSTYHDPVCSFDNERLFNYNKNSCNAYNNWLGSGETSYFRWHEWTEEY